MKKVLLIWLPLLVSVTFSAQAQQPALRGIYVNGFSSILGNSVKEDSLLHYAQDSSFNYLALYDLHNLNFGSSTTLNTLATFLRKARETYGITHIGAVGESWSFFSNRIAYYNNSRTNTNEKFNVFNVEFEFWIPSSVGTGGYYCLQYLQQANCNCDTAGAFKFYIDLVRKVDSLAAISGAISETYVGWFNQGQAQQLVQKVDRVLLHAYRTDPSTVFGYSKDRLSYLGSTSRVASVVPIFSSESVFMGPWLTGNPQLAAWNKYNSDYSALVATWKNKISLNGYQWFNYGLMPKPIGTSGSFAPTITANGSTSFCQGGYVSLTATSGNSYIWSNGATTRSITVNSSGSYTCRVTSNGTTATTPAISVTVFGSPYAAVSIINSSSNGVQLASNVMAGSGTISTYQWYLNNASLPGETFSDLVAVTDGNYQVEVTNSNGCSIRSAALSVTMPATGPACTLTTPDAVSTTEIGSTSAVLNWQAVPYCDSLLLRIRLEGSNSYIYISLPYLGQTSYVLTGLTPDQKYSWRMRTKCGRDRKSVV